MKIVELTLTLEELEMITHWGFMADNEYGLDDEDHELLSMLFDLEKSLKSTDESNQ